MKTILNFIKKNRNIILLIISFVFLTMLILGMTYAYFNLKTGGETESTMNIGGAEISATYSFSNSINITDVLPGNDVIAYKDITLTYKNTSSEEYKVYLKTVIDYSTFTNAENDGVLYYDIYSGTDHSTLVQDKTIFPTISFGKAILKEISIPANSTGTLNYRINFCFPESDKLQNPDGQLVLNASISVESDNSLKYTPTLLKQIEKMYLSNAEVNGLEQDDTIDKNIRYVGASPKNYLKFNDEIWRIIGVFNVYNNDTQKTEKLVKIIRNDSLGNYSWDSSESSINYGYGINEWSQADLMTELNTDYIDTSKTSGTTTWYNSYALKKEGSYNYSKNIKKDYANRIVNVRWNLGGIETNEQSVKEFYNQERGTAHVSSSSDGITRQNYWNGKIGLMYASDYGYASLDKTCRDNLYNCDNSTNENWIYTGTFQWTLTTSSTGSTHSYYINYQGKIYPFSAYDAENVRPALFLKSDILFFAGDGTLENPYKISEN